MPRIEPAGGSVDWPSGEGVLGVVGVAPWATLDFCRALYQAVGGTKDWHFPRLLLDINTKIPSRGRHLQLGETDPSGAIAATIRELAGQGATLAVVVCNTAHILYERWAHDSPIPILNIIEETVRYALELGAKRAAAFTSSSLAESDLYGKQAAALGLRCARLEASDQGIVNELIAAIKVTGEIGTIHAQPARNLFDRLRAAGVDTIIAGCTELSVLEGLCRNAGLQFVDSNVALARAALERLGLPDELLVRSNSG